jgi:hypothetical protein
MLSATSFASANPSVQTKTRVWDFSFAEPLNIRLNALASAETHPGFSPVQRKPASVSPHAARAAPIVGRSVGAAADITVTSAIKNSSFAVRQAKALGQAAQRDVDSLLSALRAGNTNPGIGTRALGGGFFELRGANAGRVIVHQGSANQFTIVGKFQGHVRGGTANSAIIQRLMAESGL